MDRTLVKCIARIYRSIFYITTAFLLLCTPFVHSSGFFGCNINTKPGNIFLNPGLLKKSEVFSDLTKATKCTTPGEPCANSNICKVQLRNTTISKMLPCCVKLVNGDSVCQCVMALPHSKNQCPPTSLKLVSNQLFSMSGISKFFRIKVPVCARLDGFYNIYKGTGPPKKSKAGPFIKSSGKSGFTFIAAYNNDGWYIYYYAEFVTTCKTSPLFISDDLSLCTQNCTVDLPHVSIVMDINSAELTNPKNAVFRNINSQNECNATAPTNNQCPAVMENRCDPKTQPCCYSNRCMFPYNPTKDTCPCPPKKSDAFFTSNVPLGCNLDLRLHLFNKKNPPNPQEFVWDFNPDLFPIGPNRLLTGRATIKSTVANSAATLFWFGEFRLTICALIECLLEICKNLDPNMVAGLPTQKELEILLKGCK